MRSRAEERNRSDNLPRAKLARSRKMKIFYKPFEKWSGKIIIVKEETHMKKETRTVVYDDELRIEAYRFEGIVQPFPNHFHEYYVIGFI